MADYVIVGAGTAGCVLAARLSEDPAVEVVLLEAGPGDSRAEIHMPAAFPKLFKTEVDWCYYTEDQPRLNGRKLYWPRGKVLGGSSSINAMIHVRGRRSDYDRWREMGAIGWCWDCVAPAFDRIEPLAAGLRSVNPLSLAFVEACRENGVPPTSDFNGAVQWGAGLHRVMQRQGRRLSAADAYLKPVLRRKNLKVVTHAHAARILFERGRAIGVEFTGPAKPARARADREVILAGGAVNSPQLLMLSGVGPADHLRNLGLPVVADLPGVGANLHDHLMIGVAYDCLKPITLASAATAWNLAQFTTAGRGPLTSNLAEAGAFPEHRPELQLIFAPAYYLEHGFRKPAGHGYSIGAVHIRPRSRGFVRLRSADPLAAPSIDPRYLNETADRDEMLSALDLVRQIGAAAAFAPYRGREVLPGAGVRSEADLEEYLSNNAETLYHPVGTCRIGDDEQAVVNGYLQVHGVENLRVADASVMPEIPSGNTNSPTLMIAEKAAQIIRGQAQ